MIIVDSLDKYHYHLPADLLIGSPLIPFVAVSVLKPGMVSLCTQILLSQAQFLIFSCLPKSTTACDTSTYPRFG